MTNDPHKEITNTFMGVCKKDVDAVLMNPKFRAELLGDYYWNPSHWSNTKWCGLTVIPTLEVATFEFVSFVKAGDE